MAESIEANPEATIAKYRDALGRIETAADELGRAKWQGVARRLRQKWQEWQGEDSLHEMAFGEPIE